MRRATQSLLSSGTACILLTLLGWASAPIFLKHFTGWFDAFTANGWRYGISALFWLPFLVAARLTGKAPPRLFRAALLPAAFNIVGQTLYGLAPYYIDPGLFGFLLRSQIVFVTLGAYLLFPAERGVLRSPVYWLGLAIVFAGSVGTIWFGPGWPTGPTARGIVYSISSGAFFAGYGLAVRRNMQGVNPMISFAAISLLTACGLILLMLGFGARSGAAMLDLKAAQFAVVVASAFIGIGLAHVFYYAAIARLGVSVSGGVILLMPFLTAVASYFFFRERLTVGQWACGAAAVAGAGLMLRAADRLGPAFRSVVPAASKGASPPLVGAGSRH